MGRWGVVHGIRTECWVASIGWVDVIRIMRKMKMFALVWSTLVMDKNFQVPILDLCWLGREFYVGGGYEERWS
jgi:hypothetical protein